MANTTLAFPCVCSTREKDKIFSEESFTNVVNSILNSLGISACWIGNTNAGGTAAENPKIIIDGYYFEISGNVNFNTTYRFYTKDISDLNNATYEMLYVDTDGEMLFTQDQTISGGKRSTLLTINADSNILKISNEFIKKVIESNQLTPFFIASKKGSSSAIEPEETEDYSTKKIWIKSDTMNPYIYNSSTTSWIPLGAVYKSTT